MQAAEYQGSRMRVRVAPVPASCGYTGFPSPAQDYTRAWTTLDQYLNINENTTWFFRADGDSMQGVGIEHDDVLVVDSVAMPRLGDVCIVVHEGEHLAKILGEREVDDKDAGETKKKRKHLLLSAHPAYPPVEVDHLQVFGLVIGVVRRLHRGLTPHPSLL